MSFMEKGDLKGDYAQGSTRLFQVSWQQSMTPMYSGYVLPPSLPQHQAQESILKFQDKLLDQQAFAGEEKGKEEANKWILSAPEFVPRGLQAQQQERKSGLNPKAREFKPREILCSTPDLEPKQDQQVSDHSMDTSAIDESIRADKICELNPNARDFKPKCGQAISAAPSATIQKKPEAKKKVKQLPRVLANIQEHEEEEESAPSEEVVQAKKNLIKLIRMHQQKCPQSIDVLCRDICNSTCTNHAITELYERLIREIGQEVDNKMSRGNRRKHFAAVMHNSRKFGAALNGTVLDYANGTINVRELTKSGDMVHAEPILAFVSCTGENNHCLNCFKQVASAVVPCAASCRATFCTEACATAAIQNGRHNPLTCGLFPELGKNTNLLYQLLAVVGLDRAQAIIKPNFAEAQTANTVEPVLLIEAIHLKVLLKHTNPGGNGTDQDQDQYKLPVLYRLLSALKCNPLCCDPLEEWQARVQPGPATSNQSSALASTQLRYGYVLTELVAASGPLSFSCAPNTFRRLNHTLGVVEYVARRALHPGEVVTLAWGLNEKRFPIGEKRRKTEIKTRFNVLCQCIKCDPAWRKE